VNGWPTISELIPFGYLFGFFGALAAVYWVLGAFWRSDGGDGE
jgi:hypothetical protein